MNLVGPRGTRTGLALAAVVVGVLLAAGLGPLGRRTASGAPHTLPEVPVTAMDLLNKPSNNSPVLAVDPSEERFVALANRRDAPFSCGLQVSGDGGRSWLSAEPVLALPTGADTCYAPEIAFDDDGTLYYLFVGLAGPGSSPIGAFLTSSNDRGQTFTPPLMVLGPERYQVRMAIDPDLGDGGRIHLVWLEAGSDPPLGGLPSGTNPIMAAHSDDGGRTFSLPAQVSDPNRQRVVAPALALGPDHTVHVVYYDLQDDARDYQGLEGPAWDGKWALVATSSADGGDHFRLGSVVDDEIVPPGRVMLIYTMPPPTVASDGQGGLYVGWHDARNGDWDVFVRRSGDGGNTWDEPRRANDDQLGNSRHQYLPHLSVSPNGRLDVVFYDRRGNKENRGNDVYYTSSVDGGASFAPNVKLTSVDFDSTIGPRYLVPSAQGLFEFGGRIAVVSERAKVMAAWTDTRNTGRGAPSQDIFATEIDLSGTEGSPGWLRLVGAVLALVGLGTLITFGRPWRTGT